MSGNQEDYHGIDAYFTATEFAEFSDYEKLRMRNMKQNYEMMIEVGMLLNTYGIIHWEESYIQAIIIKHRHNFKLQLGN